MDGGSETGKWKSLDEWMVAAESALMFIASITIFDDMDRELHEKALAIASVLRRML